MIVPDGAVVERHRFPMWTRQHKKRKTGALIVPAIAAVFLAYFGFHAWHGQYGLYSKYELENRVAILQARLDRLQAERKRMDHRVGLLKDGTLEQDMIDEQARRALGVARADEVIILRTVSR